MRVEEVLGIHISRPYCSVLAFNEFLVLVKTVSAVNAGFSRVDVVGDAEYTFRFRLRRSCDP